jgi:hypothetical protein
METWGHLLKSLGYITLGLVLAGIGLLLLGEYRKMFFQNPRAVMTFEVFSQLGGLGAGPGYFGVWLMYASLIFVFIGMLNLVSIIAAYVLLVVLEMAHV